MEKMYTRSNIIMMGYFLMATVLILDCTDNFPGTSILRKLKLVFLFFLVLDFISCSNKKITKTGLMVVGVLIIHTVLFGSVFVNPNVRQLTRIHCREMLIYLFLLGFLLNAVERYHCRFQFIEATCSAFTIFMLWSGTTHISNFVNPFYFIYVFSRNARIRSDFGTGSPNYMGYYCFIALVFFYAMWFEYRRNNQLTTKRKYYLLGISGWTSLILFSTGSRSSILSSMIVVVICFFEYFMKKYPKKIKNLYGMIIIVLGIVLVYTSWSTIWENANREANISVNIPIFRQMNAFWKGMGYIESSGFYADAYGYDTWPVDIYYLYIYLSTGVIGSIMIAIPLLFILYKLIRYKDDFIRYVMLPSYVAILFDGFWQVNIFTYRYVATLFIGVLLLVSISLPDRKIC